MNKRYSNLIPILIIFLFALFIRMAYFYFVMDIKSSMDYRTEHDQKSYDSIAMSLLKNKEFSVIPGEPIGIILPVYPSFLAAIYSIFGHSLVVVRIMQTLISSLSCILVFVIAKNLFNKTTAIFSGLLTALSPAMVYLAGALMNETLFIFIILSAMFFAVKFIKTNSLKDNIYFSIFMCIAMLTKELMLPFVFFLIIWYLIICGSFKKALVNSSVSILVIVLLFMPWAIRNYKVYKDPMPFISVAGKTLWEGNHPSAKGYHVIPGDKDWEALGLKKPKYTPWGWESDMTEAKRRKLYTRRAIDWLIRHPKHFLKLIPLKFIYFWGPITQTSSKTAKRFTFVYSAFYSIILIFAIFGIILSRKRFKGLLLIYLLFIYFTIGACISIAITRYRLPLEPFYIMLASYSMSKLFSKFVIERRTK